MHDIALLVAIIAGLTTIVGALFAAVRWLVKPHAGVEIVAWLRRRSITKSLIAVGAVVIVVGGVGIAVQFWPGSNGVRPTKDGPEYVWIPPGTFRMGCVPDDTECEKDEYPRHPVEITKGFWMSRTEVTVAATSHQMPEAPDFNPGWKEDTHPIVNVTWGEANPYCQWAGGRLPTEAEWEYAARGGEERLKYPWGNGITHDDANFRGTGGRDNREKTAPVGSFPPSGYGLHDMAGNVAEVVADWYDKDYYGSLPEDSPSLDPPGPSTSPEGMRVLRGGSFYFYQGYLRASNRAGYIPDLKYLSLVGFRCARDVSP